MMRTTALVVVGLVVLLAQANASLMLRSKSATRHLKKHVPHGAAVLLEKSEAENLDSVFNYESSQQKEKEEKQEKAAEMRFAKKKALPAVGNPSSTYAFGSPYGRGPMDYNTPFRGAYGAFGGGYGPMTSVPHPYQGMGSASPLLDPRGFGLTGQNDNTTDLFALKSMFPSAISPVLPQQGNQLGGFGLAYPFPAVMKGIGPDTMPFPPFSGKPFRAIGPHGPFTTNLNISLAANSPGKNTTLMGPLPFGPYGGGGPVTPGMASGPYAYGGLPQFVNRGQIPATVPGHPFSGRGPAGFVPGVPYGGPQAPFGMPSPYPHLNMGIPATGFGYGGFSQGGRAGFGGGLAAGPWSGFHPGVQPSFNAATVLHHQATMGQTKLGQFPLNGMTPPSGQGYPHPDMDRYHAVAPFPVPSPGGEAKKA